MDSRASVQRRHRPARLRRCGAWGPGVLLLAGLLAACAGSDPTHYATVLDGLKIPSGWQLVRTVVKAPTGGDIACTPAATDDCPSVARYYLAPADSAPAVYSEGKDILGAAGFTISRELFPACDAPESGPACTALAQHASDFADVAVFRPGDDAGSVVSAHPGDAIVVITAHAD
jgi:hypothetical protein